VHAALELIAAMQLTLYTSGRSLPGSDRARCSRADRCDAITSIYLPVGLRGSPEVNPVKPSLSGSDGARRSRADRCDGLRFAFGRISRTPLPAISGQRIRSRDILRPAGNAKESLYP